jgi:hypothetical protein
MIPNQSIYLDALGSIARALQRTALICPQQKNPQLKSGFLCDDGQKAIDKKHTSLSV